MEKYDPPLHHLLYVRFMVFNATFNNFSYIVAISCIGGRNQSTRCYLSLYITFSIVDHRQLQYINK